jgi:hypothetical protein
VVAETSPVLEKLNVTTFAERTGESFRIFPDGTQPLAVELVEVTDLTSPGGAGTSKRDRAPFSIVFRGPRELALPQRIYRIEHDDLGSFELFLVPIAADRDGRRYEAIFG